MGFIRLRFPSQTISLAIGDYQQKSISADSILYSIWHLKGHDFFSAALDSIHDTIPSLISNVKDQLARNYKLDYPFKRFSLIEVPIQFVGYERAWSQHRKPCNRKWSYFRKKGHCLMIWIWKKNKLENHIRWSRFGDRNEISLQEAQMHTFNNFIWRFAQTEGNYNFWCVRQGKR